MEIVETRAWQQPHRHPVHLFCDASSCHMGAVLRCDGAWLWTHHPVDSALLALFVDRNDKQIMGLELLAISLGLCSFLPWLRGRCVVIHSDNKGSEVRLLCSRPFH